LPGINFFRNQVIDFYSANIIEQYQANVRQTNDPYHLLRPGDKDKLVLTVLDNGIGVKDEDFDKLYKLFSCVSSTRSMNTKGIGLGLVIS